VKTEPYRLAADVWGIGFKTADTIAQAVGIPHDSPERVKAGLFRVGDKVTQIRNNYDKGQAGVFNGTIGVVTALDPDEQTPDRTHGRGRVHRLRLRRTRRAGPRVRDDHPPLPGIRVPRRGHPNHHQRLDDAATQPALHRRHPRQKLVVLVDSRRALAAAIRTVSAGRRHTALTHRLTG